MNKQPDNSRVAVPAAGSASAQSGRHPQSGRTFSPFTVAPSEEKASQASGPGRAVPIGRPLPDAVYQRLKEEAETTPPNPSAPKGHQDQSVVRSGRHPQSGRTFSPFTVAPSEEEASQTSGPGRAVPIGRPLPDAVYQRLKEEAETAPPDPTAPEGHEE